MAAKNLFVDKFGEISTELLLNISEILVLRLPEGTERIIASKWLKKFLACDAKDYKHNLSLFVCCLTKQMLVEPFDVPPRDLSSPQWQNFEKEYTRKDINDAVIQRLYKDALTPRYKIDISQDLHEYSCFQEIPFFGAHFYYAFSPRDRIDKWIKFNKLNVPRKQVEILRHDDPPESPIKGRGHSRARRVSFTPSTVAAANRGARPKTPRPGWQGAIEEEPEPIPAAPKPMISIPLDAPGKPIPLQLQRRMSAAAEKSRTLKSKTTLSRSTRGGGAVRKTRAGRTAGMDAIDAQLASSSSSSVQITQQKSPPMPDFSGPYADVQRRLYSLRKSNPPPELIRTTRDMSRVSGALTDEAERITREGTANIANASRLETKEVNIGGNILKIMRTYQAEEIKDAADSACDTIEQVQMTMQQLNEILKRNRGPSDDTIRRLEAIKLSMRSSSVAAANASRASDDNSSAVGLVNKLNGISEIHESMAGKLREVQPATDNDAVLIEGLESKNHDVAVTAREAAENLSKAIKSGDAGLTDILYNTALTVDQILELSLSDDEYMTRIEDLTPDVRKVVEIERKVHEARLAENVERQYTMATSTPAVARYLKYVDGDDDDIIDVHKEDLGFNETVADDEMRKTRPKRQAKLVEVDEDENLLNISDSLMSDINKSIEEIEGHLLPELDDEVNKADTQNEQKVLQNAIDSLKTNVETLDLCLDVAGEISESLLVDV